MKTSKEEKMIFYRGITPRLDWFTPSEQDALVFQAILTAEMYNADFLGILANLSFMRSIQDGKKTPK